MERCPSTGEYGVCVSLRPNDVRNCYVLISRLNLPRKQTGFWDSFVDGLMGWSYGAVRGFPTITSTWLEDWVDQCDHRGTLQHRPNNRFVQHLFRTIEGSYRYR